MSIPPVSHPCFWCEVGTTTVGSRRYWRHAGLRTIKGGIWAGLGRGRLELTQFLLLGYQRMANSWGLKANLVFLNLANIARPFTEQSDATGTMLLSASSRRDFWKFAGARPFAGQPDFTGG